MKRYSGSCGCGSIEFTLNSEIKNIVNCHCQMCRDHNGSSFSTYAALPYRDLEITKGNELIGEYKLGSGIKRFCKNCGTPLLNTNEKYPGACMIYLGTLNSISDLIPRINIWCDNKLSWIDEIVKIPCLPESIESKSA